MQKLVGGRAEAGGIESQTDCPCHQLFYTVKEALLRERMRVSCKCLQWNAGRSSYVFAGSLLVSLE